MSAEALSAPRTTWTEPVMTPLQHCRAEVIIVWKESPPHSFKITCQSEPVHETVRPIFVWQTGSCSAGGKSQLHVHPPELKLSNGYEPFMFGDGNARLTQPDTLAAPWPPPQSTHGLALGLLTISQQADVSLLQ